MYISTHSKFINIKLPVYLKSWWAVNVPISLNKICHHCLTNYVIIV